MSHWPQGLAAAITVCDEHGVILEMNARARKVFRDRGGEALLGTNALDCHPEPARTKLAALLREQRGNVYTIEKGGRRWMIHQIPWRKEGRFAGLVELSVEVPAEIPHFVRKP